MDQKKAQQRLVQGLWLLTIFAIHLLLNGCIISPQEKTVLDSGKQVFSEILNSGGGLPYIRGWKKEGEEKIKTVDQPIDAQNIEIVISTGRSKKGRIPQWRLRVFQSGDEGAVLLKECGHPEEAQAPNATLDETFECKNLPNNTQLQVLLQYQIQDWPDVTHWQDTVFLNVAYKK